MKKDYPIIEIEWKDTTYYNGHYFVEDAKDYGLKKFKTIGYLIYEDKEKVHLAMGKETTEEDKIIDFIIIPKKNIISKKIIKNK